MGEQNGWYSISYNGKTGWVSGEFISIQNESSTPSLPETYVITVRGLSKSGKDALESYLAQKNWAFETSEEGD